MGTPVRLSAFFRDDDGHGWSEQHDVDGGATNPSLTTIVTTFNDFNEAFRVPLLAGDGFYLGCRASYKRADGKIPAAPLYEDLPRHGTTNIGAVEIQMNEASNAVKLRWQDTTSTANSDIYLRGVWDEVFQAGQLNFGGAIGGAFKSLLTAYELGLKSRGYGWLGLDPTLTTRGNVTNYLQNSDGTVGFTIISTSGPPLPAAGTRIPVKFSRLNNGKSILNRQFVCVVLGPTSLVTLKQVSAGDFQQAGTFIAGVKSFILYDHIAYRTASNRKTGRPIRVGRGRLAASTLH